MLKFKVIRFRNFLSTGNRFIEMPLDQHRSTLVVGSNGAGKSTMIDALHYVLFNKPFRNIKLPQLVNSINNKMMEVEVEFSIGAHDYKVKRGRKPNVFEIWRDGEQLEQESSAKEQQQKLESIIRVDHKSFSQIVVLGSSSYTPFMELTTGARREVIEDLLDIQIFSSMNTLVKQRVKTLAEEKKDAEHDKELCAERVKALKRQIELLKEQVGEQVEEAEADLEAEQEKLGELRKEEEELTEKRIGLEQQLDKFDGLSEEFSKLQSCISKLHDKVSTADRDIKFFNEHDSCPTCEQEIEHDWVQKILEERKVHKDKFNKGIERTESQLEALKEKRDRRTALECSISDVISDLDDNRSRMDFARDNIRKIESKIASLKEKRDQGVDSDTKEAAVEAGKKLKETKARLEELDDDLKVAEVAKKLLKDDGVKGRIIEQYVPVINKLVNQYLEQLNFFVSFELDNQFNEEIKSRYRDQFSYHSFSEGQKFRINMALMLTWREVARMKNSVNTNLLIMDEVLDSSLDEAGTEEALRLLNTMDDKTNLFLISPKGKMLYDQFEQVHEYSLSKNFSVLN